MDPFQDLKTLREKKQKLLLECEVNRQVLDLEAEIIRLRMTQWKGGLGALPQTWKGLAYIGGFFAANRLKSRTARLLAATVVGVVAFSRLRGLWKLFAGLNKNPGTEPAPDRANA